MKIPETLAGRTKKLFELIATEFKQDNKQIIALIDAGVDYRTMQTGSTLLHFAAMWSDVTVVQRLLPHSELEFRTDTDNYTPLHAAAKAAKVANVQLLLEAGAEINAQDGNGQTALHLLNI